MKTALIVCDHGSKVEASNEMLFEIVDLVSKANPNIDVLGAHMEIAEPSIAQVAEKAIERGAEEVVVHPYMLAPGRHATQDVPRLVEEVAARFPEVKFRVTAPLGVHNCLANIILERAMLETSACGIKPGCQIISN